MKTGFVVGGAACVWADLEAARKLVKPDLIVVVNTIAIELERVDHWCSLHPSKFAGWLERRREKGFADPVLWAHEQPRPCCELNVVEFGKADPELNGTSALFATVIAKRKLGCDRIVLCGIPMTDTGYFDGPEGHSRKWARHLDEKYRPAWREMRTELEPCVRSMSGWTAKLLGKPTPEWLEAA